MDEVVWTRDAIKKVYVVQYRNKYGTWDDVFDGEFPDMHLAVKAASDMSPTLDLQIVERVLH